MAEQTMVGRDAVLADLTSWLGGAAVGRGRSVLVTGEAGVGKSTLADAVADQLGGQGFRVLRGWCSAAGMPAYWPWRRALATIGAGLPFERHGAGDERAVLFAAAVEALDAACHDGPLLVLVEDLHWADTASLLLLRTIVDAVPSLAIALLATARDDLPDLSDDVGAALADLPTALRRLRLPLLDDSASADLVARVTGLGVDDATVSIVVSRTGGNPFFVTEVARLLAAQGATARFVVPPGVREVLLRRLARLSQPCHALLVAAAIVGETAVDGRDPVDEDLLPAVSAVDNGRLPDLLDEAVRARLLAADPAHPRGLRFAHALVREVLVADLSREERGRLHRAAAQALAQREVPDAERLAYHWANATGSDAPAQAAAWSVAAATVAMDGLGFEQAVNHLRHALAGPVVDRISLLLRLGEAQRLAGDLAAARSSFVEAAELAGGAGRYQDLATAALGLGGGVAGFEVPIGDPVQVELLRRAAQALPERESAAVLARLSVALTGLDGEFERRRLAERAVALAETGNDPAVTSAALAAYCDAVAGPDYVRQRLDSAQRMLAVAPERVSGLLARRLRLVALLEQGDLSSVDAEIVGYERAADSLGVPLYQWLPEVWRGMRALLSGDVPAAFRHADAAERIGLRAGSGNADLLVFTLRMQAHLSAGTTGEFIEELHRILDLFRGPEISRTYYAGPALALLAAGDEQTGRGVLRSFMDTAADDIARDAEWLECHWALAELAVRLGDRPAAARLLDTLRPYEHLWAVDGIGAAVFGTTGHQLGRLAAFLGRRREAQAYLTEAERAYSRVGAVLLRDAVRAELPDTPSTGEQPGRTQVGGIRREGQLWHLSWRDRSCTVPDGKGIRDLAVLLSRPGRPVPALDLAGRAETAGGDLGPVLDATARRAYARRLADLEERLARSPDNQRLRAEHAAITAELGGARGLGGRVRTAGDPSDRARKAVTMRIRDAVRAIEAVDPALARHLRNAVKTGRMCVYEPDSEVMWRA